MSRRLSLVAALAYAGVALCAPPAAALDTSSTNPNRHLGVSGYLKELWEYSHSSFNDRPYFLNIDRARLSLDERLDLLRAHVDYDQEVYAGSYFRTQEFQSFGLGEPATWLDMNGAIASNATSLWRQKLYRGWVGAENDQGTLRFGRQRVAWGTGKLWNPTDVLNPYQPLSVEREDERTGVDAAYGRYALGELSQAELAVAPQDTYSGWAVLGRVKSNMEGYDFSFMGGKMQASTDAWMAGGDFAGNLLDGTLHGEWSYTDPHARTAFWKADLGYDYTFSQAAPFPLKNAAVVAEYFHNGEGTTNRALYNPALLLSGRQVALAQDYLGFTFSKDLSTLWKLEFALIQNLDDDSQFFNPSLQWNALPNLYLTAAWQRFGGAKNSELGRAPNLTYLQAQYYF